MKIFERLSKLYDTGWGDFAAQYVPFIINLLHEHNIQQARILDLACGTGTLAVGLARCGHTVFGIDNSHEMVRRARAKARGLKNAHFSVQDMRQFHAPGLFNVVTCTFDSLNYIFELIEVRSIIERIAAVTVPSGLFVFDINTPELYMSYQDDIVKHTLKNEQVIEHCTYNAEANEAVMTFSFSDGSFEVHRQRPYCIPEFEPLLTSSSFKILNLSAAFGRAPYTAETQKVFCVAQKT